MPKNNLQQKKISTRKKASVEIQKIRAILDSDSVDDCCWFLEYSPSQKYFHIDTLKNIKTMNFDMCRKGYHTNYIVIAGPMTFDEISSFLWNLLRSLNINELKKGRLVLKGAKVNGG